MIINNTLFYLSFQIKPVGSKLVIHLVARRRQTDTQPYKMVAVPPVKKRSYEENLRLK